MAPVQFVWLLFNAIKLWMESTILFKSEDIECICQVLDSFDAAQYYLTWRTPLFLQELGKYKLDESTALLLEGLRQQYGVERNKNLEKALACYDKAYRLHFNVIAFCKRLSLLIKESPESIGNCDEVMYEYLRCTLRNSCIISESLWVEGARKINSFNGRIQQLLQQHLNADATDPQANLLVEFFKFKIGKSSRQQFLERIKPLATNTKYTLAAVLIVQICIKSEDQEVTEEQQQLGLLCADMVIQAKQYKYFSFVGKLLYSQGRHEQAMNVFKEGFNQHFWECNKLILSINKFSCSEHGNYSKLASLLKSFVEVIVCYGHRSEFYDYIYIYNLVRKHLKEAITPEAELHYQEISKVTEKFQMDSDDSFLVLDVEYVLVVYFDQRLTIDQRIAKLKPLVSKLTSQSNKRITLYHIMKLYNRSVRAAAKSPSGASPDLISQAKSVQMEFTKYSNKTINKSEYPTALYRMAICYEKGYGVERDLGMSYMLFSKTVEQFRLKTAASSNIFNMSFLNVYSKADAARRLIGIGKTEEVVALRRRIRSKLEQENQCSICMQATCDTILFPCLHMFSEKCVQKLERDQCPMCRAAILMNLSLSGCGVGL